MNLEGKTGIIQKLLMPIVFLVVFSVVNCPHVKATQPNIVETAIVGDDGFHPISDPAIYANIVVWQDYRNGNQDIYMYDLDAPENGAVQITSNVTNQLSPAIYEHKIVWVDSRNGNQDIYMYDLDAPENGQVRITDEVANQREVDIYDNKIVWTDYRDGNWNIYMYNLTTLEETRLTSESSDEWGPKIYQNKIVWVDERDGDQHIYMCDLDHPELGQVNISDNAYGADEPDINGNIVAWEAYADESMWDPWEIFYYDLSDPEQGVVRITNDTSDQEQPRVSTEGKIVWDDSRAEDGNYDIYMYNTETGEETQITTDGDDQYPSGIYGNSIVWADRRVANVGLFMATLSYPTPPPQDNEPPTFVNIPNSEDVINISNDQIIDEEVYTVQVHPIDNTAVVKVEFYLDDILISTVEEADAEGVYVFNFDPRNISAITVIAYDAAGNVSIPLTRTITHAESIEQTVNTNDDQGDENVQQQSLNNTQVENTTESVSEVLPDAGTYTLPLKSIVYTIASIMILLISIILNLNLTQKIREKALVRRMRAKGLNQFKIN